MRNDEMMKYNCEQIFTGINENGKKLLKNLVDCIGDVQQFNVATDNGLVRVDNRVDEETGKITIWFYFVRDKYEITFTICSIESLNEIFSWI